MDKIWAETYLPFYHADKGNTDIQTPLVRNNQDVDHIISEWVKKIVHTCGIDKPFFYFDSYDGNRKSLIKI